MSGFFSYAHLCFEELGGVLRGALLGRHEDDGAAVDAQGTEVAFFLALAGDVSVGSGGVAVHGRLAGDGGVFSDAHGFLFLGVT